VQHQEIEFLRRQLETRTEEIRRRDSIIAGLTQRIPELEAPLEPQLTLENTTRTDPAQQGQAGSQEVQRGAHKAWRRRLILVAVLSVGVLALWLTSLLIALYILYL
jgi:hypothetical protein